MYDPYQMAPRSPFPPRDPYEATVRDPLEDTVPDPIMRSSRLSPARRRALEAIALIVLVPGLFAVRWLDDTQQAQQWQVPEHVTVVPRGGTGTLGHVRLRLLGRDATAPSRGSLTPAGAVRLTLVVEVRPLDAQGVKDAQMIAYSVRDRAGHVWAGLAGVGPTPAVGVAAQVKVNADLPPPLISSVVLEARKGTFGAKGRGPAQILRFAH
jgi:hypothetical protein